MVCRLIGPKKADSLDLLVRGAFGTPHLSLVCKGG